MIECIVFLLFCNPATCSDFAPVVIPELCVTTITADGYDLSFISVAVVNANGTSVPTASNEIQFAIKSRKGEIVSTDNSDPTDMVPFPSTKRKAFSGIALAIVRSKTGANREIVVEAKSKGLKGGSVVLTAK
jgi:beta-galactosidase